MASNNRFFLTYSKVLITEKNTITRGHNFIYLQSTTLRVVSLEGFEKDNQEQLPDIRWIIKIQS
jgi:hypothetical protein